MGGFQTARSLRYAHPIWRGVYDVSLTHGLENPRCSNENPPLCYISG